METKTLSCEDILSIHEALTAEFLESEDPIFPSGVKSMNLLQSAMSRQSTAIGGILKYTGAIDSAATLLYGVCNNHPFHNGNKRTAVVAMLVHLDKNGYTLFRTSQDDIFRMIVAVASHEFVKQKHKPAVSSSGHDSDVEVEAVGAWIKRRADRIAKGERQVTFRRLRQILCHFGFELENPKGNSIDLVRVETVRAGFFRKKEQTFRKRIGSIGYPGEGASVPIKVLKLARKICELTEEDGVDSDAFYSQEVRIDMFVNQYRSLLKRLARK